MGVINRKMMICIGSKMEIQRVGFRLCITNITQKKRLTVLNLVVGMWVSGLIPVITSFPK